jgi:lysophospholipase L1-like esterase
LVAAAALASSAPAAPLPADWPIGTTVAVGEGGGVGADGIEVRRGLRLHVPVAEGNHRVHLSVVGGASGSRIFVKAELRRLMVGPITLAPGQSREVSFVVNTRTPEFPGGRVELKSPRETGDEASAWDTRLSLEVLGDAFRVRGLRVEPADVPTLFLLGDSTVCDQPGEPYASWGQALPWLLEEGVAVANHAHSGETLRDSLQRRRLDKVVASARPGDVVLIQFGHNDQKQIPKGTGGPFTTYVDELTTHVKALRAVGAAPVLVSSVERRRFDSSGRPYPTLTDYAAAARQVADTEGVPFLALNEASLRLYAALGEEGSKAAFACPGGVLDNTHHSAYGAYLMARFLAAEAVRLGLPWAVHVRPEFRTFDVDAPDGPETLPFPPSPAAATFRPAGD